MGVPMGLMRGIILALVLAGNLAGCVVVRPGPYYWHPCYRCW